MASFKKTKTGWEAQIARKGLRKSKTFPTKALAQQWVGGIGMQQYSKLAIAAAIMNWPVAIGFPIAILALARQMKQKTEHASGA